MVRSKDIGINQRIPLQVLEIALVSYLKDNYEEDYIIEQLQLDFNGENRIIKALGITNKIIRNNPIITQIEEESERVLIALKRENDRNLILTALSCSAFPFYYEVLKEFARFLKVQEIVNTELIKKTMASRYGSNRSMVNGLYCVIPMLVEAGIIERPKQGIYRKTPAIEYSPTSIKIFELAIAKISTSGEWRLVKEFIRG